MRVLVGIPTHKRPELLRACLQSIQAQTGLGADVEVFVADNDPNGKAGVSLVESLAEKFRFPLTATIVKQPGISAVRNAILQFTKQGEFDFVAMIDDDEMASPGWLSRLLATQESLGTGMVGGPVVPVITQSVPAWLRSAFQVRDNPSGPIEFLDATGNVLMSCKALREINWPEFHVDYGLSGGGDTEFFLRARDLGVDFGWAQEAVVYEPVPDERLRVRWVLWRNFRYGHIGKALSRRYRLELPGTSWAVSSIALSPLLLVAAVHPKLRMKALQRVAYAAGLLAGRLGENFQEYAERHEGSQ